MPNGMDPLMGKTSIEWTDASWNPVTGCREISPGCANCYAARLAATRLNSTPAYKDLAIIEKTESNETKTRWTGEIRLHPDRVGEPRRWNRPRRIFVCDMADLFHADVPEDFIADVWKTMLQCPQHTFQVLTKRPERMRAFANKIAHPIKFASEQKTDHLPNVWLGTSVENQHFADERIPELLQTPAAVRFLSLEPLLGPIQLHRAGLGVWLHWVIVGGESGYGARPMHPEWVRSLRDQCVRESAAFFFKQWGEYSFDDEKYFRKLHSHQIKCIDENETLAYRVGKGKAGRLLDGREWSEFPETKG